MENSDQYPFGASFYEKVLNNVNDGIWVTDQKGNIIYSNSSANRLLGISPVQAKNKQKITEIYATSADTFSSLFESAKESKQTEKFLFKIHGKTGLENYHQGWFYPQIEDGEFNGMICTFRDVTESRKSKKALEKSEKMYRLMADNISDVIWTIDYNSKQFTYISPSVFKLRGLTVEEALNEPLEKSLIEEDVFKVLDILNLPLEQFLKKYNNTDVHYFEVRQRDKAGKVIWVEIAASLIIGEDGRPVEILGTTRNITDRKETEQDLRDSEERYRILADETPVAIFISEHGKCIDANAAASQIFGYTHEEFLKLQATDIIHDISKEVVQTNIEEGTEKIYEALAVDKAGNHIPVSLQGKMFNYKGKKARLTICIDQRDEIKRDKEIRDINLTLSLAVKAAKVGVFDWNQEEDILKWDKRMFDIYGVDPKFTTALQVWQDQVHPEDREETNNHLQHCLEHQQNFDAEFRILLNNGEIRNIKSHALVLKEKDRNGVRMIGVNWDITEQYQIEKELREAKNRAEESEKLKSAFLSNMSHEIRTPMNSILGFSELLLEDSELDIQQRNEFLRIISKSGRQLLDIVNDILDISKIQAGETKLNLQPTQLSKACSDIFSSFKVELNEKGIDWSMKIEESIDGMDFMCDELRIRQVLLNLISNAIKFTHNGYINLHILREGQMLLFKIEDSGIGIPENLQTKIFDRFTQVEMIGAKKYGGTGLGLSICKSLITLMKGEIWVESELNKGSSFYFTLPLNFSYELAF